ncbi:unnamed protein product, partial [Darwinula stevensoni]
TKVQEMKRVVEAERAEKARQESLERASLLRKLEGQDRLVAKLKDAMNEAQSELYEMKSKDEERSRAQ